MTTSPSNTWKRAPASWWWRFGRPCPSKCGSNLREWFSLNLFGREYDIEMHGGRCISFGTAEDARIFQVHEEEIWAILRATAEKQGIAVADFIVPAHPAFNPDDLAGSKLRALWAAMECLAMEVEDRELRYRQLSRAEWRWP